MPAVVMEREASTLPMSPKVRPTSAGRMSSVKLNEIVRAAPGGGGGVGFSPKRRVPSQVSHEQGSAQMMSVPTWMICGAANSTRNASVEVTSESPMSTSPRCRLMRENISPHAILRKPMAAPPRHEPAIKAATLFV